MRTVLNVADAVVEELNTAPGDTFGLEFTAVRRVVPEYDLRRVGGLQVVVVPRAVTAEMETRSHLLYDVQVDIGVQQHVGKELDEAVEELMELVETIGDYLRNRRLGAPTHASWVRMENEPVYAPDHLAAHHVFTSVLTMTYRLLVEK